MEINRVPNIVIYADNDIAVYYDEEREQETNNNFLNLMKHVINMCVDFFNRHTIPAMKIDKPFELDPFNEFKCISDHQIIKKLNIRSH